MGVPCSTTMLVILCSILSSGKAVDHCIHEPEACEHVRASSWMAEHQEALPNTDTQQNLLVIFCLQNSGLMGSNVVVAGGQTPY